MRLAVLLLLVACAHGQLPTPARAGDANTLLVSRVWPDVDNPLPLDIWTWRASKWYRLEDLGQPVPLTVIIAGERACVLRTIEVNLPRPLQQYRCPTAWRIPQP